MRTHYRLQLLTIVALALAGCSGSSSSSASSTATPAPLAPCETRTLTLDNATVVVVANNEAKPTRIGVEASDADVRKRVYDQAVSIFGQPHPDTRTVSRPYKWGLIQVTDLCGRPVSSASPAPPP